MSNRGLQGGAEGVEDHVNRSEGDGCPPGQQPASTKEAEEVDALLQQVTHLE